MPLDWPTVAAFAIAAAAIVVSPGPDTMLILRYALGSGRSAGLAAVAGVQIGLFVHTAAGGRGRLGADRVLADAPTAAGRGRRWLSGVAGTAGTPRARPARRRARRQGRGDASLPRGDPLQRAQSKVIVLFLALYPNFITVGGGHVTAQVVMLSAVLILINVGWQSGLVACANLARRWLVRPPVQRTMGQVTGGILIAFALAMLWEHAAGGPHGGFG